jgi:hypothetical protein
VTLVGSLTGGLADLADRVRALAGGFAPYDITLGPVVARPADPNRYRRLFSAVEPASAVLAANAAARAAFAIQGGDAYEPHLSLAYTDADAAALADLRDIAERSGVAGLTFTADRLELWRTEGGVGDWRLVDSFQLGEPAA